MSIIEARSRKSSGSINRGGERREHTPPAPPAPGALYQENLGCAALAVNTFLQKYPSALHLCGQRDRDDMLSDAHLVLWQCCLSYEPGRGVPLSLFAFKSIHWRLFTLWRRGSLRKEGGKWVRIPPPRYLSEPAAGESAGGTYASGAAPSDCLAADSGGGRWGGDGLAAILHAERLEEARRAFYAKPPWLRAKRPAMAVELEAVLGLHGHTTRSAPDDLL